MRLHNLLICITTAQVLGFVGTGCTGAQEPLGPTTPPLVVAVTRNDTAAVKAWLANKADANSQDNFGWTALMYAAGNGNVELATLLIKHGAKANTVSKDGQTALGNACSQGNLKTVELLLQKGARPNLCDSDGWTALIHTAIDGDPAIISALLSHGADANARLFDGTTALLLACRRKDTHALTSIKALIHGGAKVNKGGRGGETPLMSAARIGNVTIIHYLITSGAQISAKDNSGRTAYDYAVALKQTAAASVLKP